MFIETITKYGESDPARFHMPGHKGIVDFNLTAANDVTELFFTDNLYLPDDGVGFVSGLERRISECFFKNNDAGCVISCGGATLLIQAAVLHVLREYNKKNAGGQRYMLCDRNSHISLINALALCSAEPVWFHDAREIDGLPDPFDGEITAVFITSPDYYGRMRDIKKASDFARKRGIPLIVDNSHGSHLAFYDGGALHPMNCGADFSVDSLHKTLPVLTGGAVMHFRKSENKDNVRAAMRVFASTSPSFLILQSVEAAVSALYENGADAHSNLLSLINNFKSEIKDCGIIKDRAPSDPFRIVLNLDSYGKTGEELYFYLSGHNIICEFCDKKNVILLPSVNNSKNDFIRLTEAVKDFFADVKKDGSIACESCSHSVRLPEKALTLRECMLLPRAKVKTADSANRIAAEPVAPYPPGVPVIVCGERIDADTAVKLAGIKEYIDVVE